MSFGNKLKILRISNRLDQETISKKLNISQPVYSRYENDEKEVNEESPLLKRVTEVFNVSANWLLEPLLASTAEDENKNEMHEENYYRVPKDFLDAFVRQQRLTEQMLNLLDNAVKNGQ